MHKMLTNERVTIYHKTFNKQTKTQEIRRHVVESASWYADYKVSADSTGTTCAEVYKIRIPIENLDGYMTPDEYTKAGAPADRWTVDNGDYFVKGEAPEITKPSEISGKFSKVQSWSDNRRGALKHLRIAGW